MRGSPLKEFFPRLYHLSQNRNILIQAVYPSPSQSNHSGVLNFSRNFSDREYEDFVSLLNIIERVQVDHNLPDKRVWVWHFSGVFSCKSFKVIWKGEFPLKLKSLHGLLLWESEYL